MRKLLTSPQLRTSVKVGCTLLLLALLLAHVPLSPVADMLKRVDQLWVTCGVALGLLARLAAAERTYSISRAMRLSLSRRQTIATLFIANFWSLLLPGVAAGTVASVYRYRQLGVTLGEGVGALGVSRIVEAAVYGALTALAAAFVFAGHGRITGRDEMLLAIIAVVLLPVTFIASVHFHRSSGAAASRAKAPSTNRSRLASLLAMLPRVPRRAYPIAGISAAAQALLDAASLAAFAHALGLSVNLLAAVWINGTAYMAILLPISIAGLGARDVAVVAASAPMGLRAADALAISVLMLAATLLNALIGAVVQLVASTRAPLSQPSS